ncbi:MAG: YihY/virulence factor BrkB family protein [Myxococcota bacterium]|nr:YihY/virulence factor BrkB family protein [Myxococcota bacterium]
MTTQPPYERAYGVSVRIVRGMATHNAFEAAAAVAFWFFLSLVPLLVVVGFLLGHVARTKGVDALVGPLLDVVPTTAEAIVRKEVERLAGGDASSLAPLGVAGYLWTASSGLHNLMDVFETAGQVRRRPWWKQRSLALVWVVIGLATACALGWLLVEIDWILRNLGQYSALRSNKDIKRHVRKALYAAPHEQGIAIALMLVAGMLLLAGFYRSSVQHPARVRRRIWPGTITAVVSWLVVSWGFSAYAASIADYALYYGGLAAVAVLLVWLYLTSLSLVVGAEVNAQLEGSRRAQR